jgi:hypothetical protein
VTYTLRVHNDSATSYSHMDVFQLLPTGFHVTEATPKADLAATGPEWTAEVPAGATAVFSATATAGTVAEADHTTADHTTAEHTETVARQRSAPVASTTPNPPNPATAVPPPATTTFTTTACARDAAVGPALACGSVKQTLSDALGGADQPTKWQPGLLGLGLFAALAAGFRGYVRKRSTRSAE